MRPPPLNDEQYDYDLYVEEMSLGGERYNPLALGQQSSIGKKP